METWLDGAALKHVRVHAFQAAEPDATRLAAIERTVVGTANVAACAAAVLVVVSRAWPR